MNTEWSELNKTMQQQFKKKESFKEGIETLILLRKSLMEQMKELKEELDVEQFSSIPFMNAKGYHSKTIAYSLWHIFRIEDIVANTLIKGEEQILFSGNYKERTGSPIITTGNELVKEEIAEFSSRLNLDELYAYIEAVDCNTTALLRQLDYADLKKKFTGEDKTRILELHVVSEDENAAWLIDYWCGKDIKGLIQMPFSRHWIMHVEAALRIRDKVKKN